MYIGSTKDKEKAIKDNETARKSFGVAFPDTLAAPPSKETLLAHRDVVRGELGYAKATVASKKKGVGAAVPRSVKLVRILFIVIFFRSNQLSLLFVSLRVIQLIHLQSNLTVILTIS
jgi:hypothetical protein